MCEGARVVIELLVYLLCSKRGCSHGLVLDLLSLSFIFIPRSVVGILRRLSISHQLYPKAIREINRILMSVYLKLMVQ